MEKPQPKKGKELMGVITTQSKLHGLVLLRTTKKTWVTLTDITASDRIYWAYTKFGEQKNGRYASYLICSALHWWTAFCSHGNLYLGGKRQRIQKVFFGNLS